MPSEKDNAPLSDTEGGEKPVREQLKKAHITSNTNAVLPDQTSADTVTEGSNGVGTVDGQQQRGRPQRKRSHEEIDAEDHHENQDQNKNHSRKRSRDSTVEENELNNGQRKVSGEGARPADDSVKAAVSEDEINGATKTERPATPEYSGEKRSEAAVEAMTSPKTKRSRLHSATVEADTVLPNEKNTTNVGSFAETGQIMEEAVADDELAAQVSESSGGVKIPSMSGFANTSAVSPFGSLAGSKSPPAEPSTASNTFAASAFSALSGSATSGFGAVGKQTGGFGVGGSFASGVKSSGENEKTKPTAASAFGSALGSQSAFSSAAQGGSAFGSAASGFGKLGATGGFGTGLGGTGFSSLGAGGLSSFASGKPTVPLGASSKSTKPFGAPPADGDDEDPDDDDKSGTKSPLASEEEKQDERFYEQELETGEEDETIEFTARAKLYHYGPGEDGKKEWRERGLGVLRFNVKKATSDQDSKPRGRLLMRADGSHRVVLNTPVSKDVKYGAPTGGPPQTGLLLFLGAIDGKDGLELLQLKMKQTLALDLHSRITTLQEEM